MKSLNILHFWLLVVLSLFLIKFRDADSNTPSNLSPKPFEMTPDLRAEPSQFLNLVNVNKAEFSELVSLPGIGPALAKRILEDRSRHGEFRSLSDLQRVKGIGRKKVARLQGEAVVTPIAKR